MTRPLCKCHGTPMWWQKDSRRSGSWRCRVRKAETARRYYDNKPHRKTDENGRRMYAAGLYLGMCGFTDSETKEILQHGSPD